MKQFAVVFLLSVVTLSALAQEPPFTIKVDTALVNVLCTVTDRRGRLIPNLTKDDFIIEEDGKKQEIVKFAKENELPLTMALLMDTSNSVLPILPEEKETATAFINSIMTPKDLAMVIKFDKNARLIEDFTESKRRIGSAIDEVRKTSDGTALFDAVVMAARDHLAHESGRKAIILMSDGKDTVSSHSQRSALFSASESDSVIYSISNVFGGDGDPDNLRKLSGETGGAAFFIRRTGELTGIFEQIANELRSQYSIAYKSTNTKHDGKFRAIKITTRDTALTVRARKGYYAPTE